MTSLKVRQGSIIRVVGYIRVSDESQVDGYSLDAQKREIEIWCQRRGYQLIAVYADEGISAHTDRIDKRPQLMKLLEDAKLHFFDVVVVHTLDRWARNVGVQRQALQILGHFDIGFASVTEDVDFTTPAGRLLLTTMGGVSEFFSDQLGEHVRKAQRQLIALGLPIGAVPFGYQRLPDKGLPPSIVKSEAKAIKEAFQRRIEGQSQGQIAAWLNSQGFRTRDGHPFTPHAIRDLLNNHFYCGWLQYNDQEFQGKHEAIISEELFQQVQSKRHSHLIARTVHGPKGLLQGMIACACCGNGLQSDRHRQQVPMYRERHAHNCLTNNHAIKADIIDKQVVTIIHCLGFQQDWKLKMAKLAMAAYNGPSLESLKEKRRRLGILYRDNNISDEEYKYRLADLDGQIKQATNNRLPALDEAMELFSNIVVLWNEATTDERKKLVSSLIETAYIDLSAKQVTAIKPTPAFRALFGVGIEVGPNSLVELKLLHDIKGDIVGVGGDGGGPRIANSKPLIISINSILQQKPAPISPNLPSDVIRVYWKESSIHRYAGTTGRQRQIPNAVHQPIMSSLIQDYVNITSPLAVPVGV